MWHVNNLRNLKNTATVSGLVSLKSYLVKKTKIRFIVRSGAQYSAQY